MPLDNLDKPCPVCERPAGDHTLREWGECLGAPTTDLPFELTPEDSAEAVNAAMRERFGLADDLMVADHVVVRAVTLAAAAQGGIDVRVPGLIHEFGVGVPGKPPAEVAKIIYAGDAESVRKYGKLVRDSANGAANASER